MTSPEIISSTYPEVPEGAIFLPISRERALKNINSQIFQLLVGGRGPLGDLPLHEKVKLHKELSEDREILLGLTALGSL